MHLNITGSHCCYSKKNKMEVDKKEMHRVWAMRDILMILLEWLVYDIRDVLRFSRVCMNWRRAVRELLDFRFQPGARCVNTLCSSPSKGNRGKTSHRRQAIDWEGWPPDANARPKVQDLDVTTTAVFSHRPFQQWMEDTHWTYKFPYACKRMMIAREGPQHLHVFKSMRNYNVALLRNASTLFKVESWYQGTRFRYRHNHEVRHALGIRPFDHDWDDRDDGEGVPVRLGMLHVFPYYMCFRTVTQFDRNMELSTHLLKK